MNFKRISIVIILVLLSIPAFSQVDSTFKDTIKEITIYEYDTVYVDSDTIRLTDTIFDIIKSIPKKENKFRLFLSSMVPNSIGVNLNTFIAGNLKEKKLSDSLLYQNVINYSFSFHINYVYNKYLLSIGIGLTPYHEKYHFKQTYYSLSGTNTNGAYDSLLINNEYNAQYYYNYLNLNVLFGRKWKLNKKWFLSLNAGFIADFLVGYKQGNTITSKSKLGKFDISIAFAPHLIYNYEKHRRNFELYLSPFYQHSLLNDTKFPLTSFQKIGIGVGFKFMI